MRGNRGFTFIELGFMMLIIGLVAAAAVPNFLEAQIRAKVSRTRQDMDVMVAALQAYYADWNVYPATGHLMQPYVKDPWTDTGRSTAAMKKMKLVPLPGENSPTPTPTPAPYGGYGYGGYAGYTVGGAPSVQALLEQSGWSLTALTTPLAYLTHVLPIDVFSGKSYYNLRGPSPFGYVNLAEARKNSGAEKAADSRRFFLFSYGPGQSDIANPLMQGKFGPGIEENEQYDPSNGTTSRGTIARYGND